MQSRFSKGAREAYAKWWIRMLSYNLESSDLPSPLGAKAHSSHGMVASKAVLVLQRCRVVYAPHIRQVLDKICEPLMVEAPLWTTRQQDGFGGMFILIFKALKCCLK